MLDRERIIANLNNKSAEVLVYDTVGSTNDRAKELCKDGRQYLVVADSQTNGHGRQGKSFFSPEGSGLYFSLTVNTDSPEFSFTGVTCAVAVACTRAIEKLTDLHPGIKWVNDIYIDNKNEQNMSIKCSDVSVNGTSLDAYFDCQVLTGKIAISELQILESDLKKHEILNITTLDVTLTFTNTDTGEQISSIPLTAELSSFVG